VAGQGSPEIEPRRFGWPLWDGVPAGGGRGQFRTPWGDRLALKRKAQQEVSQRKRYVG